MLDQIDTQVDAPRRRRDRCPGVTRPWLAADGALVRVRLVGGAVSRTALAGLVSLAGAYGDGDLHLTARANLQVRGVAHADGRVAPAFVDAVRDLGLLPSPSHELVRNLMVSPLSGRVGGRADLRPVAAELDRLLLADPDCAGLAGRFLFVLDDGRGDLLARTSDLAAVAHSRDMAQLRAGRDQWGPVVPLARAAAELHGLARRFLAACGEGPSAAWHVDELGEPLLGGGTGPREEPGRGLDPSTGSGRRQPDHPGRGHQPAHPAHGRLAQDDGRVVEHVPVPDGRLTPEHAAELLARAGAEVVVTPWRSLLLPDLPGATT